MLTTVVIPRIADAPLIMVAQTVAETMAATPQSPLERQMSQVTESCQNCEWSKTSAFRYHGGFPVEHVGCPKCGGDLSWAYTFSSAETGHTNAEMQAFVGQDEGGFPEDTSPEYVAANDVLSGALTAYFDSDAAMDSAGGTDIALRPYVYDGKTGAKAVALIGRATFSIALVELLTTQNVGLTVGELVAQRNEYTVQQGGFSLFPYGTAVGVYYQVFFDDDALKSGAWQATYETYKKGVAHLHREFTRPTTENPQVKLPLKAAVAHPSNKPLLLSELGRVVLEPLLAQGPDVSETRARIRLFFDELGLEVPETDGEFHVVMDSARVRVAPIERGGRVLVRYAATVLSDVNVEELSKDKKDTPYRLLTSINHEIRFGRLVFNPSREPGAVVLEQTLLAADLDLSEFAISLVAVSEQADLLDNILQQGMGGLRADQLEAIRYDAPAADVAPLVRKLALEQVEWHTLVGVDQARENMRQMLEELRLEAEDNGEARFVFDYGSARISAQLWQDAKSTYLTLQSLVLKAPPNVEGLSEELNTLNQNAHLGAFTITRDGDVVLRETVLADDLSVEELGYALITIGQMADDYDDILKEKFGGDLGHLLTQSARI